MDLEFCNGHRTGSTSAAFFKYEVDISKVDRMTANTVPPVQFSREQWVREVEHASFVPLVMSATGGLARQASNFYKRLASLLADKWEQPYSTTLYWLRCSLSFSLLRSAIQCVRRARSLKGHPVKLTPVDLVTAEASLQTILVNWFTNFTCSLFFLHLFWFLSSSFCLYVPYMM